MPAQVLRGNDSRTATEGNDSCSGSRRTSSGRLRQAIAVVLVCVDRVPTHPVPSDMVLTANPDEFFPEIAVCHRLSPRVPPAGGRPPPGDVAIHPLLEILTVREHGHRTTFLQCGKTGNRRLQLHPVIRCLVFRSTERPLARIPAQQARPAADSRATETRAVRE